MGRLVGREGDVLVVAVFVDFPEKNCANSRLSLMLSYF